MSLNNDIIITAMDRFVWFVLLVVFSHLVTEFTRVTGYTRGTRHDSVMVNDSSMRPIRVQNQLMYPGQEYGLYDPPAQVEYNDHNNYNNYDNNNQIRDGNNNNKANNNNNLFTNFISGLFNQNSNNNNNNNNNHEFPETSSNGNSQSGDIRTLAFVRPIIDSIFEIPISTLRAVNNLVGSLTFSYRRQQQQQQTQIQPLQQLQQLFGFNNPPVPPTQQPQPQQYPAAASEMAAMPQSPSFYGMQRSATIQPKSEFEMLKRLREGKGDVDGDGDGNNEEEKPSTKPSTTASS